MTTETGELRVFQMEVVTQVLTITAKDETEAEAKYAAHFESDQTRPCGAEDCDCVEDSEDCYHNTTEITEKLNPPKADLASILEKRNQQVLSTTDEDREDLDEKNPIVFAESAPNRFRLMSMFFEDVSGGDNDGVRIQEDLDLGEITIQYFSDTENIELTEGAVYDWALDFYKNN